MSGFSFDRASSPGNRWVVLDASRAGCVAKREAEPEPKAGGEMSRFAAGETSIGHGKLLATPMIEGDPGAYGTAPQTGKGEVATCPMEAGIDKASLRRAPSLRMGKRLTRVLWCRP